MEILIEGEMCKVKFPKNGRNSSKLHKEALHLIQCAFPYDSIIEEAYLPKVELYIDILLPARNLAFEVMGEQHYHYNAHFFPNKMAFYKAQARDRLKRQILEENDIQLIELKYDEKELWPTQIKV